ncbi:translation initiation factor eIF-2B [Haladaptatus sp. CMSO5]|uniref:translation initiation factor eIF-2B n=1 Tax=Haladaptatus sp. CMSO5 TaxID=3120514 RepID=UPI002FCE6238
MDRDLSVETIRDDRDHGSAQLSLWALDVLHEGAKAADDWEEVAALARDLVAARPSMVVIENRINRVLHAAAHTSEAVAAEARAVRTRAEHADNAAATELDCLSGKTVFTLSRSGTVLTALNHATPAHVIVAVSNPGGEGVRVAERLASATKTTLVSDAGIAQALADFDVACVVVGADTILADGSVVNKVGTRVAASAANTLGIPFYAVCSLDKVSPRDGYDPEPRDADELYDGDATLGVSNPTFDRTPPDLVTGIATEAGLFDTGDVATVSTELRGLADW